MNESPLLSKMDALLRKHRGGDCADPVPATAATAAPAPSPSSEAAAASEPPAGAWLPILTDIIERGTPPPAPSRHPNAPSV
jgi:hypothetical protein